MSAKFYNSFFIHNTRSKEIKKRLIELTVLYEVLKYPREPITNYKRANKKYQPVIDDYFKLIEEMNLQRESQALMIELIIGLMYQVDYSTNPDTNDEIFSRLSQQLRSSPDPGKPADEPEMAKSGNQTRRK